MIKQYDQQAGKNSFRKKRIEGKQVNAKFTQSVKFKDDGNLN